LGKAYTYLRQRSVFHFGLSQQAEYICVQ